MQRTAAGFTLIEVMITVVIIGILTAIAVPSYSSYLLRARLTEAFTGLAGVQTSAEQYWSNQHSFAGFDQLPPNSSNFSFALSGATDSAYTVTATGSGPAAGFIYTINQSGARATTRVPTGWTTNANCWVDHKDGSCTQ